MVDEFVLSVALANTPYQRLHHLNVQYNIFATMLHQGFVYVGLSTNLQKGSLLTFMYP
jgi:hypothetical protein